ncbi:chemotaxis protein CheX [Sporomusa sphaeroides]|uniref:CheY-P phosphatase CheX n=2 Tax=Sporomusa TaxID=2375 RepID=A0ABP2C6K6_9FIRM|nr:chemotaxis protein CheX [Sporomusa sphaeroides]OLS57441.1 CheY-P phosphatase CheX [Sporomusa sphaeroides DSM 2875]CVK17995.1 CheY-P phosphatase CheX [Sporomusa sphaeroides DSM 2875]SCM81225.1 putative inhibitor of MCP methylation, CheC [uncultured Sporomusa sp.]
MDVTMINPILEAFVSIVPQLGFQTVEKKGISLKGSILTYQGVLINIGVVGPLKGAVLIGMELDSAKQFASKMMMGMEVPELDSLAQSAISEMGNMVCANACTNFAKAGIDGLDISPPTLLIGNDGQVRLAVSEVLVVNLTVDGIPVNVYCGLYK